MPRFLSLFRSSAEERERGKEAHRRYIERSRGRNRVLARQERMASIVEGGGLYHVQALRANTPRVRITSRRPGIV